MSVIVTHQLQRLRLNGSASSASGSISQRHPFDAERVPDNLGGTVEVRS
jgi:hypothetical protein